MPRTRFAPGRIALHGVHGFLMGAADIVPGVSGGTVALVLGIYERLVSSIRAAAAVPVLLLRGRVAAATGRSKEVDWAFVLPLAAGVVLAIGAGAAVILPVYAAFPHEVSAVFFGLVLASLAVPWRRITRRDAVTWALLLACAAVAFVVVGLPRQAAGAPSSLQVAGSAAIAICAMILPGVSGAYLLEVMGVYTATLEALRSLDVAYIATFAAGAAVGLGLFARLLEALLASWPSRTMAALTGLMLGALRALWPWLEDERLLLAPPMDATALLPLLLGVTAFVGLRLVLRWGSTAAT